MRRPVAEDTDQLIARASQGDQPALDDLLVRHLPALRAFLRLRGGLVVRERESCSDLAQSVCREVLGELSRFEYHGEASFRAWLFEKALSKVRSRARYHLAAKRDAGREVHATDDGRLSQLYLTQLTPSHVAMGRERLQRIEAAFDTLTEEQREAISLARIAGLGRREIAARMGRSEDAVRGLVERATMRLSWVLSRYDDEPD